MLIEWDKKIFEALFGLTHQNRWLDHLFIFFADYMAYFLILASAVFILMTADWRNRWFLFAEMSLAAILSRGIITELIRFFYDRPRPFLALGLEPLFSNDSSSFPSGHATFFFALAAVLFLYNKRAGTWFFLAALIMGAARVVSGVHWPSDILGGLAVALISVCISRSMIRPLIAEQKNRP